MTDEAENNIIKPAAEHTIIEPHPEVLESGVEFTNEGQHADEADKAIQTAVGSITDGGTTVPVVQIDNRPKQVTKADKFPVTDSHRWLEELSSFKKAKEEYKNAA